MADDIQIHKSSSCLEYIKLAERATKNHQRGVNSSKNEAAAVIRQRCPVLAVKTYLSKRKKHFNLFGRNQKSQSDGIQLCRCLVLKRSAWKTQVREPSF